MNNRALRRATGCVTWLICFGILASCLVPLAGLGAGVFTTWQADKAAGLLGSLLCPANSQPEIVTHESFVRDTMGNSEVATAYDMQCVTSTGEIVQAAGPDYALYWVAILVLMSLLVAAVMAAPFAFIILRIIRRFRQPVSEAQSI